jgi:uncharacterized protein DUF4234
MTQAAPPPDFTKPPGAQPPAQGAQPFPQGARPFPPAPSAAVGYGPPPGNGPLGKIRSTGVSILLFIITLGIYGYVWWFNVHAEMKRHRGEGIGGGLAVVIGIIVSPVAAFLTCNEVEKLYTSRGQQPEVRTTTGLWYFPGSFILIGPIVWFVKTNGALNDYWRAMGATG